MWYQSTQIHWSRMLWTKSVTMVQYAVCINVEQRSLTGLHVEHRITVEVYFVANDQLALYKTLRKVLHRTVHVYITVYAKTRSVLV
jgi:hypothetical protein